MLQDESVTRWIDQVKQGDSMAVHALWEHYFSELVTLARKQLCNSGAERRVSDEEDVALSVLNKFFQSAKSGRYPDLADRNSLWRLLIKMTANKAIDVRRRQSRQCRGGDQSRGNPVADSGELQLAEFMSDQPTPELLAIMSEQLKSLLNSLGDPQLKQLVVGKMEGFTNEELAIQLDVSTRTIERRLRLIREHYRQELEP